MKRLPDILVSFVLSPEMLIVAVSVTVCAVFYEPIGSFLASINLLKEAIGWLAIAPGALLAFTLKDRNELLKPDSTKAEKYLNWPDYQMVKDRIFITLTWELIALCITIGVWALGLNLLDPTIFSLFIGAILVSITSFATFSIAAATVKQILK